MFITLFQLFIIPTLMIAGTCLVHHMNVSNFQVHFASESYHNIQIQYHASLLSWHKKQRHACIYRDQQKKKE
jgi:hypothetical protein